ncbi:MAG: diaminopimelate epimerase, partial [Oryzihumus sp.]
MTDNGLRVTKGHGTENDFVLVPDLDGTHDLMPSQAALLADRRAGIGGDGVIRVVPTVA